MSVTATLNFGKTLIGKTSTASMTIRDTSTIASGSPSRGGGAFTGSFPAAPTGFTPSTTQIFTAANTYNGYGWLMPSSEGGTNSVSRVYSYAPTVRGVTSGTSSFTPLHGFNSPPTANTTFTGQGVAPVISLSSSSAGVVRIGTSSNPNLTITNTGDGNQAGAGLGNLTGTVSGSVNGFTGTGGSFNLADGANQTFYPFSPIAHSMSSGTVAVNATDGSTDNKNLAQNFVVNLSGTGVGPVFNASIAGTSILAGTTGSTIDFGQISPNQTAIQSLTLANLTTDLDIFNSLTTLDLLSATISGANGSMFSMSGFTPGTILSKSQSSAMQLTFAPLSFTGTGSATLTLVTDQNAAKGATGQSFVFPLKGISLLDVAWWKGANGTAWNTTSPGFNWTTAADGATPVSALPKPTTDIWFAATGASNMNTTLGQNFTVNTLNIAAGTGPVSIGGANTLTIGSGVTVASGSASHAISANVKLGATQTWAITGPSKLTVSGQISGSGSAGLVKDGTGMLVLSATNSYTGGTTVKAGTIQAASAGALPAGGNVSLTGGMVTMAESLGGAIKLGLLDISGGSASPLATFDLGNGKVILDKSLNSITTIRNEIKGAYAGGAWTGAGITSSTAAADSVAASGKGNTAVGYADNSDFGMSLATFGGVSISGTNSILMRYTVLGDANLDGTVDSTDLSLLQHSYGMTSGATWDEGDFNYDGKVDLSDYVVFRAHVGQSLSPPLKGAAMTTLPGSLSLSIANVPEPATVQLLIAAGLALGLGGLRWRRCRSLRPATI